MGTATTNAKHLKVLPPSGGVTFFLYFRFVDIAAFCFVSLRTEQNAAISATA
ncbi:hypothetical protein K239x_30040 [Planctomycetes bacterium K23_9]|uniref:Uncharacterized protein n=1 Tax=Stieleria marina TaxID=1930275 RepID=A0A517NV63_9BACT|nr:hypothetical protein K239x_30040 [Planctomycetes bacterium K23_9]